MTKGRMQRSGITAMISKIVVTIAKVLPDTTKRIGEIIKVTNDNKTKLKLEAMKINLELITNVKLPIAQEYIKRNEKMSEDLIRDLFKTCDLVMRVNYNILEIVGSEAREKNYKVFTNTIVDFLKKNPEALLIPFAPWSAATIALYSGTKIAVKKATKKKR